LLGESRYGSDECLTGTFSFSDPREDVGPRLDGALWHTDFIPLNSKPLEPDGGPVDFGSLLYLDPKQADVASTSHKRDGFALDLKRVSSILTRNLPVILMWRQSTDEKPDGA
jgi:hypothetical protein